MLLAHHPRALPNLRRALSLLVVATIVMGEARAIDLEAGLRAAYKDTGAVTAHHMSVPGIVEPVRYLRAGPLDADRTAILLHGMAFSADTWKYVGTLDALASIGVAAIALDLPHYNGPFASPAIRRRLLGDVLAALVQSKRSRVLIIAASMGGTVASPYVLSSPNKVAGYVSVSGMLDTEAAPSTSPVPTLLVWGELDSPSSSKAKAHQKIFSSHEQVIIPEAPHPAYLKDPALFNALVVSFATGRPRKTPNSSLAIELKVSARWDDSAGHTIQEL